ncbi:MAG: acyl transferase, partial [Cyclobacteriaceae bacterium]
MEDFHFLALLPSYLERRDSSLVAMLDYFVKKSRSTHSGFYLHNTEKLLDDLEKLKEDGKKTVLWGVSFALLDFAERYNPDLSHCLVFETGGMKGRRQEITRSELHAALAAGFRVEKIFSEYGMTELFSQAYTRGKNAFFTPPWMKILGRDITDPFHKGLLNETGGINVIDFANLNSIAFVETEDIGKVFGDGSFEVLGRLDNSD